jgi:hypothetical protein
VTAKECRNKNSYEDFRAISKRFVMKQADTFKLYQETGNRISKTNISAKSKSKLQRLQQLYQGHVPNRFLFKKIDKSVS